MRKMADPIRKLPGVPLQIFVSKYLKDVLDSTSRRTTVTKLTRNVLRANRRGKGGWQFSREALAQNNPLFTFCRQCGEGVLENSVKRAVNRWVH